MTAPPPGYRPGVCNIGQRERRRRYLAAGVCAVAAVAYAAGVLAWSAQTALLLGLFVPLSLGIEFLLQGRRSFCASLGLPGRFDLRGEDGSGPVTSDGGHGRSLDEFEEAGRVNDPSALEADRRYALRLTVLGVLCGGAGTALVYAAVALG